MKADMTTPRLVCSNNPTLHLQINSLKSSTEYYYFTRATMDNQRKRKRTPFGSTNYDAFIPAIMTQFDDLTGIEDGCTILT